MKKKLIYAGIAAVSIIVVFIVFYKTYLNKLQGAGKQANETKQQEPSASKPSTNDTEPYFDEALNINGAKFNLANEGVIYQLIHEMANTKVIAEEKYASIDITPERVEALIKAVNRSNWDDKARLLEMLNRWKNGDFSQAVEEHNYVWAKLGGEVGKATKLKDDNTTKSSVLTKEEVIKLVEKINPYQLKPTMSAKERYDLRQKIYSDIPSVNIANVKNAITSSALQLQGIVSDDRYKELIDKTSSRWEEYESNKLFGVPETLNIVVEYAKYQPLIDDINTVIGLSKEGVKERNVLKIIDANRILQDLARHLIQVPYVGPGEKKVDYGDLHKIYYKASKTLEGSYNLISK